jgi:uncharacterized protein YbjT (DUF2867 family)
MPQHILVIGASGYIGGHLVPALVSEGHRVRATGRNIEVLQRRNWAGFEGVELMQLHLEDGNAIRKALEDVDTVFFLIHGMDRGADFVHYELSLGQNFSAAVKGSAVRQVIYMGALVPRSGSTSKHLQAREKTGQILRASGVPVTELRSGIVIGPGSAAFEVMRDLVYHLPVMPMPHWVLSCTRPVALANLLHYMLELVKIPVTEHRLLEIGGPEVLSYEEQMRRLAQIANRPLYLFKTRWLKPSWASLLFHLVTSVPANIARALVDGMSHDLIPDSRAIEALIPQTLLPFDEAVRAALALEDEVVRTATWGFDREALSRWQPGYGYYAKNAGCTIISTASAETLYRQANLIGGENGYFFANILWRIREYMDVPFGGKVVHRRPDRALLEVGDHVDTWKVLAAEPNRFLSLMLGMKAPGLGRLEFRIEDKGDHRTIDIRAWWHPAGFIGLLYWFVMMIPHLFIFDGMARVFARQAEALEQGVGLG